MTEPSNADRLRRMADRIDHNADSPFGGACVIIPPVGGGNPIEIMLFDNNADPAHFWSTVTLKAKHAMEEADAERRRTMGLLR